MSRTPESVVLRAVLDYLRLRGVFAFRVNTTGVFDPARKRFRAFQGLRGVSDVLGCLDGGRLLAVEVKAPGGKLSPHQRLFLDEVTRLGGLALVIRDVLDLAQALDAEGV